MFLFDKDHSNQNTSSPIPLIITRIAALAPPTLEVQAGDRAIMIHLDSSAVLRLRGEGHDVALATVTDARRHRIATAAARLLSLGQIDSENPLTLTVTALDLD